MQIELLLGLYPHRAMNSHQFMLKPCNPCPDITTHQKRQSSLLSDRCDFKTCQNIFLEIKKKINFGLFENVCCMCLKLNSAVYKLNSCLISDTTRAD